MSSSNLHLSLLDDEAQWRIFSKPLKSANQTNDLWESSIVIEGMHCAACAIHIENALKNTPGVIGATVNAASQRATVRWHGTSTKPSTWMQNIVTMGYGVVPAVDAHRLEHRRHTARVMLWRWLVAGLCMMQIMMYSTPQYMADAGDMSDDALYLLRWASWVLSLPIILFSCQPFFLNAFTGIRQARISMDLPIAISIAITFVVSSLGTWDLHSPWGREVYFDSLSMFVFFLLTGRWLESRLRERTTGALEGIINRMPESVLRQTGANPDHFERVLVNQLQVGDTVRVLPGEAFPADGVVIDGKTRADEALLTGESKPISKKIGSAVIAGSYNLESMVLIRIEKIGDTTQYAQILQLMERAATEKPGLAQLADQIAIPFLISILLISGLIIIFGWSRDPSQALMAAVSVLIVTCPCALSLATPAAMLASAGALAKKGVLIQHMQAVEALAKVDVFIFDKTGTLTEGGLELRRVTTRANITAAYAFQLASLIASHSLHPISKSVVAISQEQHLLPIDFKLRGATEQPGQGVEAQLENSNGVQTFRWGSAQFCHVSALQTTSAQAHLSDQTGWLASFEFQERLRVDAAESIKALKNQGIAVRLLSGDSEAATADTAKKLHINQYQALCAPSAKLQALKDLQKKHHVAMVGDGLNDGPVLAGATVSFAFGQSAALTQSKSDFLLLSPKLDSVVLALKQAKKTMSIVKQNLAWALLYNALAVPFAVMGFVPAWLAGLGMALSSLLVVANALRLRSMR